MAMNFKAHYVPKSDDILHSTKLLERNESVNIDFIDPQPRARGDRTR